MLAPTLHHDSYSWCVSSSSLLTGALLPHFSYTRVSALDLINKSLRIEIARICLTISHAEYERTQVLKGCLLCNSLTSSYVYFQCIILWIRAISVSYFTYNRSPLNIPSCPHGATLRILEHYIWWIFLACIHFLGYSPPYPSFFMS